jgi:hypothetical protein
MVVRSSASAAASAAPAQGTAGSSCTDPNLNLKGITAQILGNQIQCDPSMNCTQPIISTVDGTPPRSQNVDVGQPIILTTNPDLPATIKPYKTIWTVGGTKIAGYKPSTGPTKVTPLKEDDLKKPNITFYWVYPNSSSPVSIPVTYQYCAEILGADADGKCSLVANASFNLTGPGDAQMTTDAYGYLNVDLIIDKPPCLPTSADEDPFLYYANASGSDSPCPADVTGDPEGIKFTQPDNSSDGSYSFVQLVTSGRISFASGSSKGAWVTIPGLDGQYPYPPNEPDDLFVSDSPDTPLVDPAAVYSKVSRTFSANMFLMWTSSKTGSIPVPIGSQKWRFSASTKNTGYPTSETWTTPATVYAGTDGDPVDYVQTAPSSLPYGYPTWKGTASKVWSTNANELDEEDEQ